MTYCHRVSAIAKLEFKHLLRDRPSLSLIFLVPVLQIILFGYAIGFDPKTIPVAVEGGAVFQQRVKDILAQSNSFAPVESFVETTAAATAATDISKIERAVRDGDALVGIALRPPQVDGVRGISVVVDASDLQTVRLALSRVETALWRQVAQDNSFSTLPEIHVEWLFNPDLRSSWAVAPALIGVIVMISTLMLGSLTLIREREQGTWEVLLASPLHHWEILLGKLCPYVLIGSLQALVVLAAAVLLFELPVAFSGGCLVLLAATPLYALAHAALGLILSTVVRTQMQAIQAAIFFYLPSILLSGFLFSFRAMPAWAQTVGEWLPLTHYVRAARSALLRGDGGLSVAAEMAPVAVFAFACCVIALLLSRRFH